jgi:hypothetical protein
MSGVMPGNPGPRDGPRSPMARRAQLVDPDRSGGVLVVEVGEGCPGSALLTQVRPEVLVDVAQRLAWSGTGHGRILSARPRSGYGCLSRVAISPI